MPDDSGWHRPDVLPIIRRIIKGAYRTLGHGVTHSEIQSRLRKDAEARRLVGEQILNSEVGNFVAWWAALSTLLKKKSKRKDVEEWKPFLSQFRQVKFQGEDAYVPQKLGSLQKLRTQVSNSRKGDLSRQGVDTSELKALSDRSEISHAYQELLKSLKVGATAFHSQLVTWPNRTKKMDVFWHDKQRFWVTFAPQMLKNRYWIAFGLENPQKRTGRAVSVRTEINPPKSGINRRCAGILLKDSKGNSYLAHSGNVGGGTRGVGKQSFLEFYEGPKESILWSQDGSGERSSVLMLGKIGEKPFLSKLAKFLVDVDNFKQGKNVGELLANATNLAENEGYFDPADAKDARTKISTEIVRRRGQPKFRKRLLAEYGGRCAITRYNCEDALEAAHIFPYLGDETDHITNGLLLRSDIHSLFDLHMIGISGDYRTIVSDLLKQTEYGKLHGKKLLLPTNRNHRPSGKALQAHRAKMSLT